MGQPFDVLIIGSGIAGLRSALALADGHRVVVCTKKQLRDSNTNWAQGGIASVLAEGDSIADHIRDTLVAGAGLCREAVVREVCEAGPAMIADLAAHGVRFDRGGDGRYELGREGGHSHRRIVHAGDATGREIEEGLVRRAREHPSITLLEGHFAADFLRDEHGAVAGISLLGPDGAPGELRARCTLLASGGSGKVYRYTSNPDIATGDGVAMAWRAGATLANLEFVQFHPTSLYHEDARNFLVSEAVRGEGAVLRNLAGEAFMRRYDERADLAPRDIVARAIDREMKERGEDHVLLDTTALGEATVRRRFPTIAARCAELGLDMVREPLPVVPAAHYQCGGVLVDGDGASDLPGLYVVGEAACTGLHGANRLASNSLLEALHFAHRACAAIGRELASGRAPGPAAAPPAGGGRPLLAATLRHDWRTARSTMWEMVGIVRDDARLAVAAKRMGDMADDAEAWVEAHAPTVDLLELRNVTRLGQLIVEAARSRRESRGLHHTLDHPAADPAWLGETCLRRGRAPWLRPLGGTA